MDIDESTVLVRHTVKYWFDYENKVLYILMMVIVSSFSYSQLNITTDLRKDLEWNTKTEKLGRSFI